MEVTIERILPGGLGLGHAEGKTIMVALAAPGDRLRVRIDREKGSVAFASLVEIIEPSPLRVDPPCPYFGRCGGCDFQHLNYEAQLEAKAEIIRDCLRRIGHLEDFPPFQVFGAPRAWHYRARTQWQYDSVRSRLGYFQAGSRQVCDVAECAVLVPELQATLEDLRAQMALGVLPDSARDFRAIAGDDDVSISPHIGDPGDAPREINSSLHGETYLLDAENFFQTNLDLIPQLIDAALADVKGENAVELYCGVGLFTVPLARRFAQVTGVESDAAATRYAQKNLSLAGLSNARIVNQDVGKWLAQNLECAGIDGALDLSRASQVGSKDRSIQSAVDAGALQNIDFLLLDPPRTGAESRVIAGILQIKPKRICYVSCDPATLARDLRKLIGGGYSLDSIAAFDMFPQTHHVETVAQLSG
jgi:23S rRNA (uracil1939-C5)-methyltransferase